MALNYKHINLKSIKKKISVSRSFRAHRKGTLQKEIKGRQKELLINFEAHPVTQDIENNREIGSSSSYGNLFTFIGLIAGSRPLTPVREILNKAIRFRKFRNVKGGKTKISNKYRVFYPSIDDFAPVARTEWGLPNWIKAVEQGIPGWPYYMNKFYPKGRSKWGLQAKNRKTGKPQRVRKGRYDARKYMSALLKNFADSFKEKRKR